MEKRGKEQKQKTKLCRWKGRKNETGNVEEEKRTWGKIFHSTGEGVGKNRLKGGRGAISYFLKTKRGKNGQLGGGWGREKGKKKKKKKNVDYHKWKKTGNRQSPKCPKRKGGEKTLEAGVP